MPVSCCGALGPGSSPRRSVPGPAGVRACLGQPSASDGLKMLRSSFSLEGVEERDEEQEDDGEDQRDGGIPFIINRGGLPVNPETWEQMWHHVTRIHPDGGALGRRIRGTSDLPKVELSLTPEQLRASRHCSADPHDTRVGFGSLFPPLKEGIVSQFRIMGKSRAARH